MFWDIAIAVLLAVLAALSTGLAGHLAATRKWQKWLFWGTGLFMVVLIFWQARRSAKAQEALQDQLNNIQRNTEKPPTVNVTVPPPEVIARQKSFVDFDHVTASWDVKNSELIMDVYTKNKSSEPALDVTAIFTAPLVRGLKGLGYPSKQIQNEAYIDFEKSIRATPGSRQALGPGESTWGSVVLPGFNEELVDRLNSRTALLFVTGKTLFSDDAGKHRKDFCLWVQPPFGSGAMMVTHVCDVHNELMY